MNFQDNNIHIVFQLRLNPSLAHPIFNLKFFISITYYYIIQCQVLQYLLVDYIKDSIIRVLLFKTKASFSLFGHSELLKNKISGFKKVLKFKTESYQLFSRVIIDSFSRRVELFPTKSTKALETASVHPRSSILIKDPSFIMNLSTSS